ncbi:hypothetical protein Q5752_001648 [Cryptotrichosporon argae]
MPPRRQDARAVVSPARSMRSTRGRAGLDDDWDGESVASSHAPTSRKNGNASLIGLKDTSVNIAAAFHAAQTGSALPTPPVHRAFPKHRATGAKPRPAASTSAAQPQPQQSQRATSPAEQLASAARALSPVRFFLRPGSVDDSGEYASFSSVGAGANGARSAEASYDYTAENDYVRAAQEKDKGKPRAKAPRKSAEDRPYRPAEDEVAYDSDSQGEGQGIVRAGALDGRAHKRGKRKEKGEGYLGMGLGLQPRARRSQRSGGGGASFEDGELSSEEMEEVEEYHHRGYSPLLDDARPNGAYRSPTPAQLLRALSPRADRTAPSALSPLTSKRRQPSPLRTVVTNITHGIALVLRFFVDLVASVLDRGVAHPLRVSLRAARDNWLKWLLGLAALGLAIRLARSGTVGRQAGYAAPQAPPGSMDELVARLAAIEQTLLALSADAKSLGSAQAADRRKAESSVTTIGDLNTQLDKARSSLSLRQDATTNSLHELRAEVGRIASEVGKHGASLSALSTVGTDVAALTKRVASVERSVQDALDDGRIRSALERLLPAHLPVRTNTRGTIELDPSFWAELRRVFVGHGEIETAVRRLVGAGATTHQSPVAWSVDAHAHELDDWAARLFSRQIEHGVVVSRADFMRVLESEVSGLKAEIDALARRPAPVAGHAPVSAGAPGVTIKTAKGEDVTSALQGLIDAALLKYSKDVLARPDYALFTAGARVVPSITSDTLVLRGAARLPALLWGARRVEGRPPATALHPDTSVGSCWPFAGATGQLGVMLAKPVRVTDVTLEHAARELALDTATAPRDVEVWAVVGDADRERVAAYLADADAAGEPERKSGLEPGPGHASADKIRLAAFTYDPAGPAPIQTFPVDPAVRALALETAIVVVEVKSNWGGEFTCLYRVRVHGEAV